MKRRDEVTVGILLTVFPLAHGVILGALYLPVAFMLIGILLFGVGLLGEYVGRIYLQVRDRPRYMIQAVLEDNAAAVSNDSVPALTPVSQSQP